MGKHTASQVARWFLSYNRIAIAEEGGEYISNLKLQKLLYYAQGSFLALTGRPIFDDKILAWQHGPVVESVYYEYKSNGSNGIVFEDDFDDKEFSEEENKILSEVYNVFGQYSASKLRNMTHKETPWLQTPLSEEIPQDVIKDYFKKEYVEQ